MADKKRKEPPSQPPQPQQPHVRVITGDELGLIRVADVPAGPNWEHIAIVARCCLGTSGQAALAVARATGEIDILQASDGALVAVIPKTVGGNGAAGVCGMAFLPRGNADDDAQDSGAPRPFRLVSCTTSGLVRVHVAQPEQGSGGGACSGRQPDVGAGAAGDSIPSCWTEAACFQTCSNVACMAVDTSGRHVAVGGTGCHVQVWNLDQQQQVFKAKGGKPNKLGLVDLPNITALAFLPSASAASDTAAAPVASTASASAGSDAARTPPPALQLLAGTAQHKLWLYRLAVGQRPQMEVAWGEAKITALAPELNGKRVWVANGQGNMERLDVAAAKVSGGLKGSGGSVRSMELDSGLGLVASVGLDRYLRLHDAESRRCLGKLYLKQQLTAVVFAPVPVLAPAALEAPEPADAQEQQLDQEQQVEEGAVKAVVPRGAGKKAKSNLPKTAKSNLPKTAKSNLPKTKKSRRS